MSNRAAENSVVEDRYEELNLLLSDPTVISDQPRYLKLLQEHADIEPLALNFKRLKEVQTTLTENKDLLYQTDDQEFKDLIREEIHNLEMEAEALQTEITTAMMPSDPNDNKNVFMEIRGGVGGEEAALFASDLFRMYSYYTDKQGWQIEVVDHNETEIGGLKEMVFMITGKGAYSRFKFESGVHRVQRVPVTESGGRIHTSAVTVAVLPEVEDVDIEINPADLQIDTYRASGAGGQHVNKTSSAIRITHLPTGLVVTCQDQRSQHKNKDRAMQVLRSRLYELEQSKLSEGIADDRRKQVGSGDRSERIRTYNFPQSRVTDHRIGLTLYRLEDILAGDLDLLIKPLQAAWHDQQILEASS